MVISLSLRPQQAHLANEWMHWKNSFTNTFYIGHERGEISSRRVLHQQTSLSRAKNTRCSSHHIIVPRIDQMWPP
jgi:hypothetical protein